jgi:hypothetical protein
LSAARPIIFRAFNQRLRRRCFVPFLRLFSELLIRDCDAGVLFRFSDFDFPGPNLRALTSHSQNEECRRPGNFSRSPQSDAESFLYPVISHETEILDLGAPTRQLIMMRMGTWWGCKNLARKNGGRGLQVCLSLLAPALSTTHDAVPETAMHAGVGRGRC